MCRACGKSHPESPCRARHILLSLRMAAGVEYESDRNSIGGNGEAEASLFVTEVKKLERRISELEAVVKAVADD